MAGSIVKVRADTQASILENPDAVSTKRMAWAFGCAKKDSDEERALYKVLRARFEKIIREGVSD